MKKYLITIERTETMYMTGFLGIFGNSVESHPARESKIIEADNEVLAIEKALFGEIGTSVVDIRELK